MQIHATAEELSDRFFDSLNRLVRKNNSIADKSAGESINAKNLRTKVESNYVEEEEVRNAILHIVNLLVLHDKGVPQKDFAKFYPREANNVDLALRFRTFTNAFFVQRILNGSDHWGVIQLLIMWAAVTLAIILIARALLRIRETREADGNRPVRVFLRAFYDDSANAEPHSEDAIKKAEVTALAQAKERSAVLHSLIWVIPSLGFVGTMIGIGLSLSEAGAVITPEYVDKQSAIQNITRLLSVSFDTTLLALVASIPLTFALNSDQVKTEKMIVDFAGYKKAVASKTQFEALEGQESPKIADKPNRGAEIEE